MAENSLESIVEELKAKMAPEEMKHNELLIDCFMDLRALPIDRLEGYAMLIKASRKVTSN